MCGSQADIGTSRYVTQKRAAKMGWVAGHASHPLRQRSGKRGESALLRARCGDVELACVERRPRATSHERFIAQSDQWHARCGGCGLFCFSMGRSSRPLSFCVVAVAAFLRALLSACVEASALLRASSDTNPLFAGSNAESTGDALGPGLFRDRAQPLLQQLPVPPPGLFDGPTVATFGCGLLCVCVCMCVCVCLFVCLRVSAWVLKSVA